jgi:hypothetical protein
MPHRCHGLRGWVESWQERRQKGQAMIPNQKADLALSAAAEKAAWLKMRKTKIGHASYEARREWKLAHHRWVLDMQAKS